MFFTEIEYGTPAFDESIALRDLILRKPLGLEFTVEQITEEYDQYHLVCYDDWRLLGCLVLKKIDDKTMKMRQVAIDENVQRKGIGSQLVGFSEDFAIKKGFSKMILHARDVAVPFYKKLNYQIIGKPFTEVGIKHFAMEKVIET